jgi:hypothetical protein
LKPETDLKKNIRSGNRLGNNQFNNNLGKIILTKKFLIKEYKYKSLSRIGKEVKCDGSLVLYYMKKYGIARREAKSYKLGNNFDIKKIKTYLDGLLLSDGTIQVYKEFSGYYDQRCTHREWLEIIQNFFSKHNIQSKIYLLKTKNGTKEYFIYRLRTLGYPEFRQIHHKWYVNRIKIVPEDTDLTPDCLANWFMGDGTRSTNGGISLSTISYSKEDTALLVKKLNETIGINSHTDAYNRIYIKKKDAKILLRYIKKYKIPCYAYKWNEKA